MNKQFAIRRVRIAASMFFGVLTVAMCVLWVRSYRFIDIFKGPVTPARSFVVDSVQGRLAVGVYDYARPSDRPWEFDYFLVEDREMWSSRAKAGPAFSFRGTTVAVPFLFVVIASAMFAVFPWFQFSHRFSLNTMFLITTLVAIVLGLSIWMAR